MCERSLKVRAQRPLKATSSLWIGSESHLRRLLNELPTTYFGIKWPSIRKGQSHQEYSFTLDSPLELKPFLVQPTRNGFSKHDVEILMFA